MKKNSTNKSLQMPPQKMVIGSETLQSTNETHQQGNSMQQQQKVLEHPREYTTKHQLYTPSMAHLYVKRNEKVP